MNQNDILIQEKDFYFCQAFQRIINLPSSELVKELGNQEDLNAAKDYFANLPTENYQNPMVIANQIASFCRRSENNNLNKLLRKFYLSLDPDGISNLLTTKKDPGETAEADPHIERNMTNEARDICKDIEKWAKQEKDNNQSDQNDSNSN